MNLTVVLFSVILFFDILTAVDHRSERPGAVAEYLIYNFGTSVLWIVEIALRVDDKSKDQPHVIAEWIVAVYFVCDSIDLLVKWKLTEKDLDGDLVEAFVGIISYSYMAYETFEPYYKSKSEYEQISVGPSNVSTLAV